MSNYRVRSREERLEWLFARQRQRVERRDGLASLRELQAENERFNNRLRFDQSIFWERNWQCTDDPPMMLSCFLVEEYARLYGEGP